MDLTVVQCPHMERHLPGLADGLIGQAIGESRDIRLALPADYPKKDLAGSDVVFRVTVKSVKERRLPALDDELARQVGRGQTLAELQQEVHDELQEAAHQADEQRFENDVLKALDERMEAEIPEALIDREVNRRVRELELRLQEQGVKMERYLEYTINGRDPRPRGNRNPYAAPRTSVGVVSATKASRGAPRIPLPIRSANVALKTQFADVANGNKGLESAARP